MASLQSLPAPLPLHIAELLPDLKALDAMRRSSALFAIVFAQHAAEIFEHIMLARTTLDVDTVIELRAYVLLVAYGSRWRHAPNAYDRLRESAQTPLDRTTPAEAVSIALRTFSYFHTLCTRVATEKLNELYALPHRHAETPVRNMHEYYTLVGVPFEVPSPLPLHWIEEQRFMKSLFQIRSYALLGLGAPPTPPEERYVRQCSIVQECYHFFNAHMDDITCERIPTDLCWQAPVIMPPQTSEEVPLWPSDLKYSEFTKGWQDFRSCCCLRRPSPFNKQDWPVFRGLGLGLWSFQRLAEDLKLVRPPQWLRESRAAHARARGIEGYWAVEDEPAFTWWMLGQVRRSENEIVHMPISRMKLPVQRSANEVVH